MRICPGSPPRRPYELPSFFRQPDRAVEGDADQVSGGDLGGVSNKSCDLPEGASDDQSVTYAPSASGEDAGTAGAYVANHTTRTSLGTLYLA
jgi:hypothetical protein